MDSFFSIAAVGDISFMGRLADQPSDFVFKDILPAFAGMDLVVANLESPLPVSYTQLRAHET